MGLFLDKANFLPSREKSWPLPQYLLQYDFDPFTAEITRGIIKQSIPNHAKSILKKPSVRYKADTIHIYSYQGFFMLPPPTYL
jgi:hypothetical protein